MKILLVGAGGFAQNYINILLAEKAPSIELQGIVDPYFAASEEKARIESRGIPIYDTMQAFYAHHTADLAIICTPTHLHCEQSVFAVANGSNVLCEKPLAPTVKEAERMNNAQKEYRRFIAIGYQWSFSDAMRKLKKDILSGVFGAPLSFKTLVCWPRSRGYYERGSGWAGRIQKDGRLVLDSIASNACAHHLHNMLFLLGDTMETSAPTELLRAECYRANAIENFDTCVMKMRTARGVDLYFAASHATKEQKNPTFIYSFEKGRVMYSEDETPQLRAEFQSGDTKIYGNPSENAFQKLADCIAAVRNGTKPICTVETATPHVHLIADLYRTTEIQDFSGEAIRYDTEKDAVYVEGLLEALSSAYRKEAFLSEVCK